MTDEELAAIRERVDRAYRAALVKPDADWPVPMMALWYSNDGNALLAEVERLRAREHASQVADSPQALEAAEREHDRWMAEHVALREIAQAVADMEFPSYEDDTEYCPFCQATLTQRTDGVWAIPHTADCALPKARALLGTGGGDNP